MREKFPVLDIVVHRIVQGLLFQVCGYNCMTLSVFSCEFRAVVHSFVAYPLL